MSTKQKVRVLLIDDDRAFAEHFRLYADISKWQAEWLDISELDKLLDTLQEHDPNLILLDNSKSLHQWLKILDQQNYIKRTHVTLGRVASDVDTATLPTIESLNQNGYLIASIIGKPFRLTIIPSLIKPDAPQTISLYTSPQADVR